jgi:hypothetical protein
MVSTSSLLPYLDRQRGSFSIDLLPGSASKGHGRSTDNPFRVLDDSFPFCSLLRADLVTDADTSVQHLFLIKQKDAYIGRDGLSSNQDVDAAWLKAWKALDDGGEPCIRLAAQHDSLGHLQPFSSLFFCAAKGVFFHPPCPECGHPLELCTSDGILGQSGLPAYSTSLERYLCCRECFGKGADPVFYAFNPSLDQPPCVHDQHALIKGYGNLSVQPSPDLGFPCLECSSFSTCFAAERQAWPPISIFGFYPFYLFILEQPTFRADDFLALLSGSDPGQLGERHRKRGDWSMAVHLEQTLSRFQKHWFLQPQGESRFVEILFLKMTFLLDVLEKLIARTASTPVQNILETSNLSSFWVKLGNKSKTLPHFWDFSVSWLNHLNPEAATRLPKALHISQGLNRFGMLCFSILLADRDTLPEKLESAAQNQAREGMDWESLFPPASISLERFGSRLPPAALNAWHESLDFCWRFLTPEANLDEVAFLDSQLGRLESLIQDLRKMLFERPEPFQTFEPLSESSSLVTIMDDIIASWSSRQDGPRADSAAQEKPAAQDETILFNLDSGEPADEDTMNIDETRVETVFLSLDDKEPEASPSQGSVDEPSQLQDEPELERTVFVQTGQPPPPEASRTEAPPPKAPPPAAPPQVDDLDATVILSRDQDFGGPEAEREADTQPPKNEKVEEEGDDLEKTVILDTRKTRGGGRGQG